MPNDEILKSESVNGIFVCEVQLQWKTTDNQQGGRSLTTIHHNWPDSYRGFR